MASKPKAASLDFPELRLIMLTFFSADRPRQGPTPLPLEYFSLFI